MELASNYGIVSLIPVTVVIVTAVISKKTVEPLILGALVGYVILYKASFFTEFLYGFTEIISENSWFVLVFGLYGMVILLLEQSGGALGFGEFGTKIAKTRASSLIITWILGIIVFIDDYLNNLGVGTAMRNITDKHNVAREYLAYVINSTGAAVCVLVPMSSWAILMISIYDGLGVQVNGSSFTAYVHTIPFMFYAWAAVLIVPLIALKIIPMWGPMKKAQLRADEGQLFPENSQVKQIGGYEDIKPTSMWNFILPMVALTAVTIYTNDILIGMAVGFIVCLVLYLPQKIMTLTELCTHSVEGFKSMVLCTAIVLSAFLLQKANGELGLTEYVISVAEPVINAKLLPVISFIICSVIAAFTGSFWGTMTIASPILIPLATTLGADTILVGGAIVSAGAFGSHTCFFGDAVTLASAVTGISNTDYARTALPMIIAPTAIAIILFTIFGFII
ncbi:MAG: Na+/H+ antiporter NhaC family protein [Bacillota bacterium]|jgi:tetracycline resistance efflux pump|nr:Na+/H+ antiporter NhaC family protein [Bacillota bacterium]